ncbi:MAG: response regulator, partial [Candidatus Hydrogenedentes bacterium]|nr:response regulator [Candidatus Hydrogenedentota bacterium]
MRTYLQEVLIREGHECEAVSTCAEGRGLFQKGLFACALIDLGLPDGSGLDLLAEFAGEDPCLVTIVLTGDASAETVISTMRSGAFDYLTKPVDAVSLRAAIGRALAHHAVSNERTELFRLLLEEREQLRAKVEAATLDIRQYASACELSNARLRGLLKLAQLSNQYYSEEQLFRQVFAELAHHVPIRALALCDCLRSRLTCAMHTSSEFEIEVVSSVGANASVTGFDPLMAEAEPAMMIHEWLDRNTRLDTSTVTAFVFPQALWKRSTTVVAFFLEKGFTAGDGDAEFLDTCAYFLAFEWERAQLLFHIAHHASLGNIAIELARNFIQPLTAIQMAGDFITETLETDDERQGMKIIDENVDKLRRQTQEFRKLSLMRENAIETVRLDEYVDQALAMLSVAIQSRGVTIQREFIPDCECVLLNGTALARTFLDLLLGALRVVEMGGVLILRLYDMNMDHITFEINHSGAKGVAPTITSPAFSAVYASSDNPGLMLAERAIHSCGGNLTTELAEDSRAIVRIVLPRNATTVS